MNNAKKYNFSLGIPTYNRPHDLRRCLDSILKQTVLPLEVLIIDDGELSDKYIKEIEEIFKKSEVNLIYSKKDHIREKRGSSESRNKALRIARGDILFILDDDVILDKNFIKKIMKIWNENKNKKLIGVGGIITNNRKKNRIEKIFNKIFILESQHKWDVNDIGFQIWDDGISEKIKCFYVHGGVCSYDKNLVQKLGFSTFGGGRTALEDVDFCLRAKKEGYFFILNPEAKVIHNKSVENREKDFLMGFKESFNRKIIFRNNCKRNIKNYLLFCWAFTGWILRQLLVFNFYKSAGMIKGAFTSTKDIG
jgi:GT2 family glycosyltransferase